MFDMIIVRRSYCRSDRTQNNYLNFASKIEVGDFYHRRIQTKNKRELLLPLLDYQRVQSKSQEPFVSSLRLTDCHSSNFIFFFVFLFIDLFLKIEYTFAKSSNE